MAGLTVLKVVAEGAVTSFRYPHFIQGVHPTYDVPPPATIYGHVCSAVGEMLPPDTLQFAYHFATAAKFEDYEHLHFFGGTAKMNPFRRELLFNPKLTLYLRVMRPEIITLEELSEAFRSPRYAVVLGRSQDLMSYTEVQLSELEKADRAFYCGTLLTLQDSAKVGGPSFAVTMPRFLSETRQPQWAQYAVLLDDPNPVTHPSEDGVQFGRLDEIWIDPAAPHPFRADLYRGVLWHGWVE